MYTFRFRRMNYCPSKLHAKREAETVAELSQKAHIVKNNEQLALYRRDPTSRSSLGLVGPHSEGRPAQTGHPEFGPNDSSLPVCLQTAELQQQLLSLNNQQLLQQLTSVASDLIRIRSRLLVASVVC